MLKSQQQVHKSGGERGGCMLEPASHSHWHWPTEDLLSPEKGVHYTVLQERGIFGLLRTQLGTVEKFRVLIETAPDRGVRV